ncbi:MAG: hypothetical protein OEX09_03120, partial [Candidatus Bathyarchaeota archaeon]|nr:hypothetical protein [Candidatus Bathyarchaeota archaeon]
RLSLPKLLSNLEMAFRKTRESVHQVTKATGFRVPVLSPQRLETKFILDMIAFGHTRFLKVVMF